MILVLLSNSLLGRENIKSKDTGTETVPFKRNMKGACTSVAELVKRQAAEVSPEKGQTMTSETSSVTAVIPTKHD